MGKEKLLLIVDKAKQGDNNSFNSLFTETYNDVYYFALKTVKDETIAADVTQETFVTIFQNINTLNDPVAYPAWSRQITYRHCLQYLKKQNREVVVEENEDGSNIFDTIEEDRTEFIPEENLDKEDFKKTILEMVDSLPEEQRTAVILYYYDELSIKEIAEIQCVTEGTVKSRLNYARKAIKASVESYEKKHNVKLRCAGVLPLLLWLFASDFGSSAMSATTAQTVATGVSATTGTTLSVSSLVKSGTKFIWTLWQKIVAGIAAAAITISGTVAVVNHVNTSNNSDYEVYESEECVASTWIGKGAINVGLNLSDENEFELYTEMSDEYHITGVLTVRVADGSSYSRTFEGAGRMDDALFPESVFYDIRLSEEVEPWLGEGSGITELTLKYDEKEQTIQFYLGPYDAVLKGK